MCAASEAGEYRPATKQDFEAALTRRWVLCNPPSVFGTTEAGLEIRPDGRWSKLQRSADGFVRLRDWGNTGRWTAVDTSMMNGPGSFQLNLHVDGENFAVGGHPVFARAVPKVRIPHHINSAADYVELPEGTVIRDDQPNGSSDVCDATEDGEYRPTTREAVVTALTRAWRLCTASSVFGSDEAGLEIRADGRWSKLQRTDDGFQRMHGWGHEGRWELFDTSAMNGPGHFQLNLYVDGGGAGFAGSPHFAAAVPKMRLHRYPTASDYAALPAGSPIRDSSQRRS